MSDERDDPAASPPQADVPADDRPYVPYVVPPHIRELYDSTDRLLEGLSSSRRRAAVASLYFDGDGRPQAHSLRSLRVVREEPDDAPEEPAPTS